MLDRVDRSVAVLDLVDGLALEQPPKTVPVVKDRHLRRWPLTRKTPKIVGKISSAPTAVGVISAFVRSHSFDVTPCCSGPAPMIIDAQLGLLTVGITPVRAGCTPPPSSSAPGWASAPSTPHQGSDRQPRR